MKPILICLFLYECFKLLATNKQIDLKKKLSYFTGRPIMSRGICQMWRGKSTGCDEVLRKETVKNWTYNHGSVVLWANPLRLSKEV